MAAPQITLFTGTVPSRVGQTKQEFSDNINDWIGYQQGQITDTNIVSNFINDTATQVNSSANIAATAITSANFKGSWSNLTGAIPDPAVDATTVFHIATGLYYQALNAIADVTLSEPGVTSDWALSAQSGSRVIIIPPLTLDISGKYYIQGNGVVTIPVPSTLGNGSVFDFDLAFGDNPNIFVLGGSNLIKVKKTGVLDSDIDLEDRPLNMTSIDGFWEV